jgi:hypothetical protein
LFDYCQDVANSVLEIRGGICLCSVVHDVFVFLSAVSEVLVGCKSMSIIEQYSYNVK